MAAMLTHGGKMVDLLNVTPEDIDLDDIAHALANINRFTGHALRPYSVAEHSINVARLLPEPIKIYGLLHDAHEAYIGDISTPLKKSLAVFASTISFREMLDEIEKNVDTAIYSALKVPPPGTLIQQAVKYADTTMAVKEMRELFDTPPPAGRWLIDETLPLPRWKLYGADEAERVIWSNAFRTAVLAAAEASHYA